MPGGQETGTGRDGRSGAEPCVLGGSGRLTIQRSNLKTRSQVCSWKTESSKQPSASWSTLPDYRARQISDRELGLLRIGGYGEEEGRAMGAPLSSAAYVSGCRVAAEAGLPSGGE